MSGDELFKRLDDRQIPQLVLLYGGEPYLIQEAARAVRKAVLAADQDDFNDNRFDGKEASGSEILEAAMTFPVFAEKRLVTVKNAHQLKAADLDILLPYLENPVPETCLLLVADKVDNRRKFFQQFKKSGIFVEFKPLSDRDVPRYVRNTLARQKITISAPAVDLFCSMVGNNLHEIHAELDKLVTYIGTRRQIDSGEVQAVVSRGRAENIFELGNAVGRGDVAAALVLLGRLGAAGEAPLKILSLLVRHFRQLWKVRELQAKGHPRKDIAKVAGVPPFVVEGLIRQGKKFSRLDFVRAHELFLETDLAMKSSGADAEALLENLILNLVKKSGQ